MLTLTALAGPGLLVVTILLMFILYWPKRELIKKGLKLPGHTPIPIFGNLLQLASYSTNGFKAISGMCAAFNGFCAIWQGHTLIVLVSDAKYLKDVYTNVIDRADQLKHVLEWFGPETLFPSSGEVWKRSRKRFMMTFSPTPTAEIIDNYSAVSTYMMNQLKKYENGAEFKSWHLIQSCIGQNIVRSTLGEIPDPNFYTDVADQLDFVARQIFKRQLSVLDVSNAMYALTPDGRKYMKSAALAKDWCKQAVMRKKNEFNRMKASGEPVPNLWIFNTFEKFDKLNMDAVSDDLANIVISGMETTTNALGYLMVMLGLHPELQEKIFQEDKEVQDSIRGRPVTLEDLDQYVYLERFIKESMRMFPIGEVIARKLDTDTYFGEYLVPKGANILALPMQINRDPKNFYEPNKFDPDRHLPENTKSLDPFLFASFGAGPRSCPGAKFAMIGLRILVTSVIRKYRIKTSYNSIDEVTKNIVAEPSLTDSRKFPISLVTR